MLAEYEDKIIDHVVSFYENLYNVGNYVDNELIEENIPRSVTEAQNMDLCVVPVKMKSNM